MELHKRGPANSLLHPQLTALHAPRKIDFAFPGKQRDGTHFAQIHPYRIIGVNRLFYRMSSREFLCIVHLFRMEEAAFLVKRKT